MKEPIISAGTKVLEGFSLKALTGTSLGSALAAAAAAVTATVFVFDEMNRIRLDECARQNGVAACELVAEPVDAK